MRDYIRTTIYHYCHIRGGIRGQCYEPKKVRSLPWSRIYEYPRPTTKHQRMHLWNGFSPLQEIWQEMLPFLGIITNLLFLPRSHLLLMAKSNLRNHKMNAMFMGMEYFKSQIICQVWWLLLCCGFSSNFNILVVIHVIIWQWMTKFTSLASRSTLSSLIQFLKVAYSSFDQFFLSIIIAKSYIRVS